MINRVRCIFLSMLATVSVVSASPTARLQTRAQQYMSAWQKKDTSLMWSFESPRVRKHDGSEAYKDGLRLFFETSTLDWYEIKEVERTGDVGFIKVEIKLTVEAEHIKRQFSESERMRWIYVANGGQKDGEWYLDEGIKGQAQIDDEKTRSTEQYAHSVEVSSLHDGDRAAILNLNLVEQLLTHRRVGVRYATKVRVVKKYS